MLFVGFDKSEKARYCAIRSTVGNFKIDATGSDKHYSFKLFSREPKNTLHLFESAIDLLSYATLLKRKKNDWRSENLLSLAGVYQPQKDIQQSKVPVALKQYLEDYCIKKEVYKMVIEEICHLSGAQLNLLIQLKLKIWHGNSIRS